MRKGVLSLALCPVFMGSAYKNKGVQRLLDKLESLAGEVAWRLPAGLLSRPPRPLR